MIESRTCPRDFKAERKAAATTNNGWPKIRREDIRISPEVMKLVEDIEPLPEDFDYDKARLDYLEITGTVLLIIFRSNKFARKVKTLMTLYTTAMFSSHAEAQRAQRVSFSSF